jgi:hypothetical protein
MQYKIPQNVQIEDKIVGPLTLKQLIILGTGGGISYALYSALAAKYYIEIWIWFVAPPAILTLAFTFLKINGIPFAKWVLLLSEYMYNPRKRIFQMGAGDNYKATIFAKKEEKVQTNKDEKTKAERDRERLDKLSEITKLVDDYAPPQK